MNRVPVKVVAGPLPELPAGWVALKLQVELARVIREQRPRGVLIELADASHLPALRRALADWPLAQYLSAEPPA